MHSYINRGQSTGLVDRGAPEDIGAEAVSGPVQCSGKIDLSLPDGPLFGELFAATRGVYRVIYPFHEHAMVLEGEVELTYERTGVTSLHDQGERRLIEKGPPVRSSIKSDRILKSYLDTRAELEADRN